jgi:hypothetical protein
MCIVFFYRKRLVFIENGTKIISSCFGGKLHNSGPQFFIFLFLFYIFFFSRGVIDIYIFGRHVE